MRFSLDQLFRYVVSGGITLLTLAILNADLFTADILSNKGFIVGVLTYSILFSVSTIIGVLLYCINETLFQPLLMTIFVSLIRGKFTKWHIIPTDYQIEFSKWMWNRREAKNPVQIAMDSWSSKIHLMYCSALGIFIVVWICWFLDVSPIYSKKAILIIWFGLLLFVLAVISDASQATFVFKEYCKRRNNRSKSSKRG